MSFYSKGFPIVMVCCLWIGPFLRFFGRRGKTKGGIWLNKSPREIWLNKDAGFGKTKGTSCCWLA